MKPSPVSLFAGLLLAATSLATTPALADDTVKCNSSGYRHSTCRLDKPGRVTLQRQTSNTPCVQGRNWDYDARAIWVDDGCSGEFRVDSSSHDRKTVSTAAGVIAAAVLLGALAEQKPQDDPKYTDANYFGPKHSSYVPGWMVGQFRGVNTKYDNAEVLLTIKPDGQVAALSNGHEIRGYINDDHLHAGDVVFTINRSDNGFATAQLGDPLNVVHYRRIQ